MDLEDRLISYRNYQLNLINNLPCSGRDCRPFTRVQEVFSKDIFIENDFKNYF